MHFLQRQPASQWLARLARLLPSSCALCGMTQEDAICPECHRRFFSSPSRHRCRQCAVPLADPSASMCGDCLQHPPEFDGTIVAADYAPPVDQLVLALKFGGRLALAPLFSRLLRDAVLQARGRHAALPTLLIAVPLAGERLVERGFNQAHEIAKPLASSLGIALVPHMAWRTRDTRAQSQLPLQERHDNLRDAFSIEPQTVASLRGQHVGVVDDVITTGATLNALAAVLKRFGAARVTNLVFARTP